MHFIRIQNVLTKGGSLRYYIARENSKWKVDSSVEKISSDEYKGNDLRKLFQEFSETIEEEKEYEDDEQFDEPFNLNELLSA